MDTRFLRSVVLLIGFLMCAGCGNANVANLTKPAWYPEFAHWPELDALDAPPDGSDEGSSGMNFRKLDRIFREAVQDLRTIAESQSESKGGVKLNYSQLSVQGTSLSGLLENPGLLELLQKAKDTAIPGKYSTPERQTALTDYLKSWDDLRKLCKANANPAELYQQYLKLANSRAKVRYIPGQTPPTGDAVEKYSGVVPYENPYETKL